MLNVLILLASTFAAPPDSWPAFLGQGASPINAETIPITWTPTENIAWQAKLPGKGQSSPIIWNGRVFVTSIEGSMKDKCHLVGLSLSDGRELWRQTVAASQTVRSNYFQSRSAPTPAVDAKHVYAFFETGNVVATDHEGKIAWQRNLTEDYGPFESNIGLASSPLLVNDVLVILVDHEGPSYLLGLDAKSGETRWKTERTSRTSYSSPAVVPVAGTLQIVCSSAGSIDGYDPNTGAMLWTYDEGIGGNRASTPLAIGDGLFAIGASPGMHNEREEEAKKTNFVMHVDLVEGKSVPKIVWRTEEAMPSHCSPYAYAGHAYWVNRSGVIFCYDLKTGQNCYAKRANGVCWATPVGIGDRVYFFSKDGMTTVLKTGPEHIVLAENMLWDPEKAGRDSMARDRSAAGHQGHGEQPATAGGPTSAGKPQSGERSGSGRPAMTEKEQAENRARGENRFADPVQYGVAIVNGSIVIRTGDVLYCVRPTPASAAVE